MENTPNIGLRKPEDTEIGNNADLNYNSDIIDEEMAKRGKSVNGILVDENGDFKVPEVPFAGNLTSDDAQQMSGEFLFRTTGGDASLSDGDAMLISVMGRRTHTGVVAESLTLTVDAVAREEGELQITAEIDRDTFVAYVSNSGTTTLTYTDAWSANPSLYGVTVTGTPISGDKIVIVYVKEERGTITPATPSAFRSTGWNLYNNTLGYARVKKYSDTYGFLIGGTYSAVQFSATLNGTKSTITPVNGYFTIPSDGYVWVTGGNTTDTYVLMTWSDWTEGPDGDFATYTEDTISLSSIMSTYFPNGLCQVGSVSDEINLNSGYAIVRISRMAYSAENLAAAQATGRDFEYDENYIYIVKETYDATAITIDGSFDAYDHGLEIIDGSSVEVYVQTLYGQNLKDKLRTDVLTISQQTLTAAHQAQARANIGAAGSDSLSATQDGLAIVAIGNTHVAISSGQFVYVKNHSTLAEGLYKATAAIAANATLSSSNLTADSKGGLNSLSDQITTLNSNVADILIKTTTTSQQVILTKIGTLYHLHYERYSPVDNGTLVTTLNSNYAPTGTVMGHDWYSQTSGFGVVRCTVGADGKIYLSGVTYAQPIAGVFDLFWEK